VVARWLADELVEPFGGDRSVLVSGVCLVSGLVVPGDLYVAAPGARVHGARFARDAVSAGAVALLTDADGAAQCAGLPVPVLVVEHPRAVVGRLSARVFGEPARDVRLIAVTGTQGKTTTTRLAEAALQSSGVPAAVVGTIGTRIDGVDIASELTTPEAPALHALFAVMREQGVRGCAMEVSSHALVMGRVDGVVFDVAAFLNLGRDHLDFHADVEDYYRAKASLFTPARARLGLVNIDDEHGRRLAREAEIPLRTFAVEDSGADWTVSDVVAGPDGSRFVVRPPDGEPFPALVPIPGDFNISNALCALACLAEAGFDAPSAARAMAVSHGVPGRLEKVDAGQEFLALVDYAHKPDAVEAALRALRPQTTGRLIVVLGAGGERDPGKRPLMGEVAARLADVLLVTDDNPRGEDPAAIRAAVAEGADAVAEAERADVRVIGDRRAAIAQAVSLAGAGDTVLVAGKGHETGQQVGATTHPFDDRVVLREELTR
jgi:UDP-N-acetylmuramoyl-L-alanyl-D-glutamate--2,6-diaminopimelate ligase